ncbi:pyruvate formate-lyase-activating protein [Pseudoflavonifractor sp. CLA-AP-H29]|uniref:Pyruvate formate-lyase-activating enzyme n=1 Tax=Pseudoflavonifractor intestinihominis TaxID=3133171 RepID=A0ABV1E6Z5_9FIRM
MRACNTGRIHSVESFGTVDGPGVRFVVFFQGCPMRCLYCHNPDTWATEGGTEMTVDELLAAYERNKGFYRRGGITATGGEPLLQLPFLTALFTAAKERGIHTCLDTSGIVYRPERQGEFDALFAVTDLVLLDVKHAIPEGHRNLTGHGQAPVLSFARALDRAKVPMVVRHVVVPGLTDTPQELKALGRLLAPFRNLKGLEVLPYHTMGAAKYEALGIPYLLSGVPAMDKDKARAARDTILAELRQARSEMRK